MYRREINKYIKQNWTPSWIYLWDLCLKVLIAVNTTATSRSHALQMYHSQFVLQEQPHCTVQSNRRLLAPWLMKAPVVDAEGFKRTNNKVDRSPDGPIHSPPNLSARIDNCWITASVYFLYFSNLQKTCPPKFYLHSLMTTTLSTFPAHRNLPHFTTPTTPTDLYKSHSSSSCNTHPSYIPSPS